jgi:hypothetical protein
MSLVEAIAQAIAKEEGFYVPGSIAQRNHNPGNLRSWGSAPIVSGYAVAPDDATGWSWLYSQVQTNIGRGLTLNEFFAGKPGVYDGYAPSADKNRPYAYAAFVAGQVGIPTDVPLNALGSTPATEPAIGDVVDYTNSISSDPSQAGTIDWATLGLVGLGALVLWYLADEFF